MKLSKTSGATIAAAAAVLVMSGAAFAPAAFAAADEKVHCYGVNDCTGKSGCKTATNDCSGKNTCKGKGFLSLTKAECTTKGGSLTEMNAEPPKPAEKKS